MENKKNYEGYENEEIITLKDAQGNDIEFVNIAGIALDSGFYMILQPKELLEGMADDEALVFEVKENGEDSHFNIVLDDELIDKVFKEYYRLLDEVEDGD